MRVTIMALGIILAAGPALADTTLVPCKSKDRPTLTTDCFIPMTDGRVVLRGDMIKHFNTALTSPPWVHTNTPPVTYPAQPEEDEYPHR